MDNQRNCLSGYPDDGCTFVASDDVHPIHLHRHSFELTRIAGKPTSGVMKDVVMLGGYQEAEIDFIANNPGKTLFHCHQQLHMDFGFMCLFDYI
jgi:FtsP/CotA-like multicopper oxidase with cupredoxin domain